VFILAVRVVYFDEESEEGPAVDPLLQLLLYLGHQFLPFLLFQLDQRADEFV